MGIDGYFYLDGRSTREFGVGLSAGGAYDSPMRNVEDIHIFGRSGDAVIDSGAYNNVEIIYPCWIAHNFAGLFPAFRAFLAAHMDKYYTLSDSYDTDHFRKARVSRALEPDILVRRRAGTFDVAFDCKPQRYTNTGAIPVSFSSSGTITNPESFSAMPLLVITGTGTVTIAGQEIEIDSGCPASSVTLDCETMDAYAVVSGVITNLNNYVTTPLETIVIPSGQQSVSLSGVSSVVITPNWYTL